jgi:hypothetical protein
LGCLVCLGNVIQIISTFLAVKSFVKYCFESSSGYNKEIKRDEDGGRREKEGGKKRWRRKRSFKNRQSEEAREERDGQLEVVEVGRIDCVSHGGREW